MSSEKLGRREEEILMRALTDALRKRNTEEPVSFFFEHIKSMVMQFIAWKLVDPLWMKQINRLAGVWICAGSVGFKH